MVLRTILPPTPPSSPHLGPNLITQIQVKRQSPVQVSPNSRQTKEVIPPNCALTENNEEWVHCLIPTTSLEQSPWWVQHRSVHVVGNHLDDEFVDVAVIKPDIERLRNTVDLRSATIKRCLYEPSQREEHVYGTHRASERARGRFIDSAVDGILTRGPGLGCFYRRHVDDVSLLAVIEWAILQRDIEVSLRGSVICLSTDFTQASPPDIRDRFLLSCLFVTLVLLDNLCGDFVTNILMKKDKDDWMELLRDVCAAHIARPPEDPEESKHKAAILRVLLEWDVPDVSRFDGKRSVNDNLTMLCDLFVGFDEPMPFRCFDDWVVQDVLSRGPLDYAYEDVVEVQKDLSLIWFRKEIYDAWPAAVVNALPYGVVCDVWVGRWVPLFIIRLSANT